MKKENVIDLLKYRDQCHAMEADADSLISDELKTEIQNLIHRLRELGPIQKPR
jgi:hypothetical protein